jgi:hypothetical protein
MSVRIPALFLLAACCAPTASAAEDRPFDLEYTITVRQPTRDALVEIRVGGGGLVKQVVFSLREGRQGEARADGTLQVAGGKATWTPPARGGTFSLVAKIDHERRGNGYDAYMGRRWAIFRGDDLVPSAKVRLAKGATSRATLRFRLPPGWDNADTGWLHGKDGSHFVIDNPERRFDRPVGWMIVGDLGTRREQIGPTEFSVAAPKGSGLHRMDVLTFVTYAWPSYREAFGERLPPKVLLVGGGEPMWRGGLSAPNSMFLHVERPLVSENGTSTLLHELVHVATRIRGQRKEDDWIAEGLAEYYAIELMHRAGGMTDARRERVREDLKRWSADVETLLVRRSTGPVTARAALLFEAIDAEIRARSAGKRSLDDVVRSLIRRRDVSLRELREAAEKAAGGPLKSLDTPLLR